MLNGIISAAKKIPLVNFIFSFYQKNENNKRSLEDSASNTIVLTDDVLIDNTLTDIEPKLTNKRRKKSESKILIDLTNEEDDKPSLIFNNINNMTENENQKGLQLQIKLNEVMAEHRGIYKEFMKLDTEDYPNIPKRLLGPICKNHDGQLDDDCMNLFCNLLVLRFPQNKIAVLDSLHFIDSEGNSEFKKLLQRVGENLEHTNISSKRKNDRIKQRQKYKNANIIFWPVHVPGHWHMYIIEKIKDNTYTIHGLDGFNQFSTHAQNCNKIKTFLRALYQDQNQTKLTITTGTYAIQQQQDSVSCGVIALHFAERRCEESDFSTVKNEKYNTNKLRLGQAQVLIESISKLRIPSETAEDSDEVEVVNQNKSQNK